MRKVDEGETPTPCASDDMTFALRRTLAKSMPARFSLNRPSQLPEFPPPT